MASVRTALRHGEQTHGCIQGTLAGGRAPAGDRAGGAQGISGCCAQGAQVGELGGEQKVLARLLVRKFGKLDEATENRLRNASTEEINRWTDQILIARTLDEVFHLQ